MGRVTGLTVAGIVIALLFSLLYVGLYPMLTGGFVIYWYPYWPRPLAAVYVTAGVLLQAWFCYRRWTTLPARGVVPQTLAGIGYLVVPAIVSGGPYQS
ncbi:MAG TPA: hypothetical protein VD833_08925 [Vicinamibacterales bacterium]|nr:hypothetical protein [Vicinamibacterales bacterium]